jgi:AcrR family transcriptional regulator
MAGPVHASTGDSCSSEAGVRTRGRRRSLLKAQAILEGAKQEFLERGFAAASMDRIAALAGVSKATIYNHYGNKEGLFRALTTVMVKRRVEDVFQDSLVTPGATDSTCELIALADRILAAQQRQPDMLDFLRLVIGESARCPDLAKGFVAEVEHHALERLVTIFSGISDRPELKARMFIGTLMHTILFQDVLHGDAIDASARRSLSRQLVEQLVSQPSCHG